MDQDYPRLHIKTYVKSASGDIYESDIANYLPLNINICVPPTGNNFGRPTDGLVPDAQKSLSGYDTTEIEMEIGTTYSF